MRDWFSALPCVRRVSRGLERLEKSLKKDLSGGVRLASLAMPVPAALITGIVSSTVDSDKGAEIADLKQQLSDVTIVAHCLPMKSPLR